VSGLSEYDNGAAICDCDARNEDVLVENAEGATVDAIVAIQLCNFQ
jgi:hypothetical protein